MYVSITVLTCLFPVFAFAGAADRTSSKVVSLRRAADAGMRVALDPKASVEDAARVQSSLHQRLIELIGSTVDGERLHRTLEAAARELDREFDVDPSLPADDRGRVVGVLRFHHAAQVLETLIPPSRATHRPRETLYHLEGMLIALFQSHAHIWRVQNSATLLDLAGDLKDLEPAAKTSEWLKLDDLRRMLIAGAAATDPAVQRSHLVSALTEILTARERLSLADCPSRLAVGGV